MKEINRIDIRSILVTAPLSSAARIQLEKLGEVIYEPWVHEEGMHISSALEMAERITQTQADLLICESDLCAGPVFASGIKVIAACRTTPINIDLDGATAAGIPVIYTPGRNSDAIAEHTLALLFTLNQNLLQADREFKAGAHFKPGIPHQKYRNEELRGKVFGIVGLSAAGAAVKWRAEALGLETLACDPYNPNAHASMEDVLKNSHIISVHAPAIKETLGLMGNQEFAACRSGAIYLNTSSSSLHDLNALTNALSMGHLAGAGLDLVTGENLPPGHPLLEMDNVILSPGIGGISANTENRQGMMVIADLLRLFEGARPLHIANPEVLVRVPKTTKKVKASGTPQPTNSNGTAKPANRNRTSRSAASKSARKRPIAKRLEA